MNRLARALRTASFATRVAPQFKHGRVATLAKRSSSNRFFATNSRDEESDPIERAAALLWEPIKPVSPEAEGATGSRTGRGRSNNHIKEPSKGALALQRIVEDAKVNCVVMIKLCDKRQWQISFDRELMMIFFLILFDPVCLDYRSYPARVRT